MTLCAVCAVAACGGGGNHLTDAAPAPDAPVSDTAAMPDAGPPPCGYTEQADTTNEATVELTELTVGATPQILCGTINAGHFDMDSTTVDVDRYRVTSDGTNLIVRFAGAPGAADAAVMPDFSVSVFTTDDNPLLLSGARNSAIVPDHGAFLLALPAGMYDLAVRVQSATELAAGFDYRVQIAPDGPTRCPAVTAPASYTEAADGTGADNDVVAVAFGVDGVPPYQLTASTADAPEPTGLTIDGTTPVRITGSSADENADDDYMDRDTYLVHTAATTGELTLRLLGGSEQAPLDYLVFPAGQTDPLGDSFPSPINDKYNVVAVKPDSAYWIWVGRHDGSTGLPAAYDLTLCGASQVR